MSCRRIKGEFFTLHAGDGTPLLLYGTNAVGYLFLWPLPGIERHRVAFARWCRRNVEGFRGRRVLLQHELPPRTLRWARWLAVPCDGLPVGSEVTI